MTFSRSLAVSHLTPLVATLDSAVIVSEFSPTQLEPPDAHVLVFFRLQKHSGQKPTQEVNLWEWHQAMHTCYLCRLMVSRNPRFSKDLESAILADI